MSGKNWGMKLKGKAFILSGILLKRVQTKHLYASVFGTTLLLCNVGYGKEQRLGAGGQRSWTAACDWFWCHLGGGATSDTLHIANGNQSGSFTFTSIDLRTNNFGGSVDLNIKSEKPWEGKITIHDIYTSHTGVVGFNGNVNINVDTKIGGLAHNNKGGGTRLNVVVGADNGAYKKNLHIDRVSFNQNGLAGSQGVINLYANNINIGKAAGRLSQVLNVNADGSIVADDVYFDGIGGVGGFAVIPKSEIKFNAKEGGFISQSIKGMGHSNIFVNTKKDIVVGNVGFAVDICITQACAGWIELNSKEGDVIVKSVTGGTANESGIGSFNTLQIKGNNFYAGKVEAISLVTSLNNSYLDLTGVKNTTFIDDLQFRNGTLKAKNFHFNNFTVWKANANRVGFEHPTDGSAYTTVSENIGKSFINNLSMEIGTSHTADSAALWFKGGGDILNINFVAARPTSYINFGDIKQVNINELSAMEADIYMKTGIFNTITNKKGQTIITNGASKIVANALNVNELLHIKDSSKHSGVMNIELNGNEEVKQDFDKYLKVSADSKDLKNMSADEIKKLIESSKSQNNNTSGTNTADYQNASGTYVTTSDGKHYLILPDIMTNENITNNKIQAANGGNILIEQTTLTKGALNNYGKILLDAGFVGGDKPTLYLKGNLNNYNAIDIGANGTISVSGTFNNQGRLIFRIQSDPSNATTEVKNGSMIISGNTTFDISPGTAGAFQADIADAATLANLGNSSNNGKQYNLVTVNNGGSINYTYTYGDYTTTFSKNNGSASISTTHKDGNSGCKNNNCQTNTSNGGTQQETDFTTNGKDNPWDMDKAQTDSNGNVVENG
ncbi:autotransporter domain-containing protein, partial [Helicobacter bilis]